MTVVILHHAGDANVPPVRVPGTVALVERYGAEIGMHRVRVVVLGGPEAFDLAMRLTWHRVIPYTGARSTVGEIIASRPIASDLKADTLIISTEQGHRFRAYLAARIIYAFTGVRVIRADYPGGTYRSPPWEYVRDVLAATWWKLTHRVLE